MNGLIKQFLYILGLSIICGLIRYFTLIDSVLDSNNFSPGPRLTNIEYAKDLYDKGLGCFIDARDIDEFNEGHILGSINIPFGDTYDDSLLDSLANEIVVSHEGKAHRVLIVYCGGEGCSLSEDLAYGLSEYFFEEVIFYFEEGFPIWKDLEYPTKIPDLDMLKNDIKPAKPLLNFIDYIMIASIFLIFALYFSDTYKSFIPIISRFILGFIFVYFSWDKILDPKLFADVIKNYDIMPFGFEELVAFILPFIEFFIGICLILGIFIDISAIISITLLVMFILMIGQAYLRGKSIDCGCLLSDLSESSSSEKRIHMIKRIIQDICFILYALIVKYRVVFKRNK